MFKQKAFTLFEIIIVIILISVIYTFTINSFTNGQKRLNNNITLLNLKKYLLSLEFENNVRIECIEDDLSCFVFVDNILQKETIKDLFIEIPNIYNYHRDMDKMYFKDLDLEQLQSYNIVFKYACKKNGKCDELIVEDTNIVYLFNNINKAPDTVNYLSDVGDYFYDKIQEVKDAI